MTQQQKRFVDYYIETGDAKGAALRAGYSLSYAYHVYRQPGVQAYMAQRRAEVDAARIAPADEVAATLTNIIRTDRSNDARIAAAEALARRMGYFRSTDELRSALRRMRRAYVNKDPDCPHDFELRALAEAKRLLGDDWPNEPEKDTEEGGLTQ